MAARANLPKIVTDVQDIVAQLSDDFKTSSEPITDDNHALHRLCAKLEFLLSSSTKEKSMLGNKKSYWHWTYACLKNTKGLADGLKFVQANKELRTSKGRGRAFIRYCLVHQTLADSLQNCVMNQSITRQYFTSDSVLINPTYSVAFVTSLYELNAVNFDLNAKGYDLDAGWPTFASKIRNSVPTEIDHWAIRSHVGSLSSFPSASVVMDAPRMHGSGSSGAHSVDQRVEELVLELDQSDQKIKDQQLVILELETKAETSSKSAAEKEEILAGVISDLESKNRHLHTAMSNMSSEFEAREQQWSDKHSKIVKDMNSCENKNKDLLAKISQLEQDKRTLEDMVSQRMSVITSAFVPTTEGETYASKSPDQFKELENLRSEVRNSSEELKKSRERCVELQARLDKAVFDSNATNDSTSKIVEEKQAKIDFMEEKLASVTTKHQLFINNVKEILSLGSDVTEVSDILQEIVKIRDRCMTQTDSLLQAQNSSTDLAAASLMEENELLKFDRDIAHLDADSLKHKLRKAQLEIRSLKIENESDRNRAAIRVRELEESFSIQQHETENQQRHHKEMLADLKLTQDALQQSEKELESVKQRYEKLQQSERELRQEYDKLKQAHEEDNQDNDCTVTELQAELDHQLSLNETLDRQLESEKAKSIRLGSELLSAKQVAESFSKQLNETNFSISKTEKSLAALRDEVSRLTTLENAHEKQITFLSGLVEHFLGQMKLIDETADLNLELKEKLQDDDLSDEVVLNEWKNLSATFHHIALEHKETKSEIQLLRSQHEEMKKQTSLYKAKSEKEMIDLRERLTDSQSANEIHLITIKDLSDKHKNLQDSKAENLDKVDRLQVEIGELNTSLKESKAVEDDLRLRVMEESAKRLDVEDKLKMRDEDIENLKDKVTQLLLDKDHLWKEGELLKDQLEDQLDVVEEASWMNDDTVKNKKNSRLSDQCSSTPADLDMSSISPIRTPEWSRHSQSMSSVKDRSIPSDECSVLDDDSGAEDSSIFSSRDDTQSSMKGEATITVAARREFHLPVQIEQTGLSLHWEITTDRDIGFKICYAPSEEEAMLELVPLSRINSHVEPFVGNLVARQEGVYTLVFDNTYSRFTSKTVNYKLGILSSDLLTPT